MFNRHCKCEDKVRQHVHGAEGNTMLADGHKHCFNSVTGRAIPCKNSHVHEVEFVTDIVDCHCHKICGITGPAIPTGFDDHIHLIEGGTTFNDGHNHCVKVATGTERPICRD
jgi:hypothetical protein